METKNYLEKVNVTDNDSIIKYIIEQGEGDVAKNGQKVTAHYTGKLLDGTKFDSSHDRNQPFEFILGLGQVIKAWELTIATMKKGEKVKIVSTSEYCYGENGSDKIPPNSSLEFKIELLDIKDVPKKIEDMTPDERFEIANDLRERGNEEFKQEKYKDAYRLYNKGLDHVQEHSEKTKKIYTKLNLNVCVCSSKQKNWPYCVEFSEYVLQREPENIKALYYHGVGQMNLWEYEKAKKTFNKILELDSDNKSAKYKLVELNKRVNEDNKKDKQVFGNWLSSNK